MKSAILLSGGLDSTALAYWLRPSLAITIDYGQIAAPSELRAAKIISRKLGIGHEEFKIDLNAFGSGPMAGRSQNPAASTPEWWPFRNQLLITLAASIAIQRSFEELLIGSVRSDATHADGTEYFFRIADELVRMQEGGLRLRAPAAHLSTSELIKRSGAPKSLLAWSYSCNMGKIPCQRCSACKKQIYALSEIGFF
jgi:7-cyano-7-deazaguanine synthase